MAAMILVLPSNFISRPHRDMPLVSNIMLSGMRNSMVSTIDHFRWWPPLIFKIDTKRAIRIPVLHLNFISRSQRAIIVVSKFMFSV